MKISTQLFNSVSRVLFAGLELKTSDILYQNPLHRLKHYLEIDVFKENEFAFSPNIETLKMAEDLFVTKRGHEIKVVAKTNDPEKYPSHDIPEVAFLGQSNAGKSSLIKAIFKEVPDLNVRTSKKPGHTKRVHFFTIGSKLCLVDLPGYGERLPAWLTDAVESYFKKRKNLMKTILLIDGKVGFQNWDERALEMLEEFRIPYVMVMTKIDAGTDSTLLRNLLHLKKIKDGYTSLCCFPQIFMTSSHSFEGLAYLLAFIAHITGNLSVDAGSNM